MVLTLALNDLDLAVNFGVAFLTVTVTFAVDPLRLSSPANLTVAVYDVLGAKLANANVT